MSKFFTIDRFVINSIDDISKLFPNMVKGRKNSNLLSSHDWIYRLIEDENTTDEQKVVVQSLTNNALIHYKSGFGIKACRKLLQKSWVHGQVCQLCPDNEKIQFGEDQLDAGQVDFDHITKIKHFSISDGIEKWSMPLDAIAYEMSVLTRVVCCSCHRHFTKLQINKLLKHGDKIPVSEQELIRKVTSKRRMEL